MKGAGLGFVLGVALASAVWWFGTAYSDKDSGSPNRDSLYWSARGTNPEYWSSNGGNKDLTAADADDCHQLVGYRHSKEYLIWEDRLMLFRDCMKKKGYEFAVDAVSVTKERD